MKTIAILSCAIATILTSCVTTSPPPAAPSAALIQAEKFPRPSVAAAKKAVMDSIYRTYKDPDSAVFRDFSVTDFGGVADTQGSWLFGYKVTCMMNIKNGRGAYGGYRRYAYIVIDGGLATEIEGWRLNTRTYEHVPYVHRRFQRF